MAQSYISGTIAAITEIKPAPSAGKDIEEAVKFIQTEASKEPGCLLFSVSTKKEDPDTFVMFEIFKDQQALDNHKKQEHTIRFGKMLEGKYIDNKVTFLDVAGTKIKS